VASRDVAAKGNAPIAIARSVKSADVVLIGSPHVPG
jgi:hypothetical protein